MGWNVALATGTKLGPYEVMSPAGAGGMGEVYRARDTRLDRTVAIKILSTHLASDPDLRQRFEREAKSISSLNHPHICHLYDVGSQDGTDFLVMEFVEGQTLAERLQKGPLAVEDVLRIGSDVADALDKAHRRGIIHRDLKPGNIMLTKTGAKLMDFGLAKPAPALIPAATAGPLTPSTPTVNLTAAQPAPARTQAGMIVGTFQYLAPEVLQGSAADERSDLFSFGCVLYEMITARPAFKGKSQLSVLAAILEHDPESIATLQPETPPALQAIVRSCLAKDPEQRIQSAHDVTLQLQLVRELGTSAIAPARNRRALAGIAGAAALLAVMAAVLGWWLWPRTQPRDLPLVQLSVMLAPGMNIAPLSPPAVAPDGSALAFVAHSQDGSDAVYVRRLDTPMIRRLDGTELATYPFWSPDSTSVGFFAAGQLKRVDVATGVVQNVAEAPDGRGGAWSKDGVILFSARAGSPLYRVNASGGTPQQLTELHGQQSHRWPFFLPDGRRFIYTAQQGTAPGGIFLASLDDPHGRLLSSAVVNGQVVDDWLVFARGTSLVAAKVDFQAAKLAPETTLIAERVRLFNDRNIAEFSMAGNGTLAYYSGTSDNTQLAWFDRAGKMIETVNARDVRGEFDLSRDGRHLVTDYSAPDGQQRIEVLDLARGASPIARTFTESESPAMSPTGESIVVGGEQLVRKWIDGSEREEVLLKNGDRVYPDHWSQDGRWLVYEHMDKQTNFDLMVLDMRAKAEPQVYLRTPANEAHARISPDGRWLAYVSDESGRPEVYVQSFPTPGGGKWQISTQGGDQPFWRADGGELFFLSSDLGLMSVPMHAGKSLDPGVPLKLFNTRSYLSGITGTRNTYVAAPDGKRFLVQFVPPEAGSSSIGIVFNWQQKLKSGPSPAR